MGKTLFDKVWDSHVVDQLEDGPDILYIDKHLIHEVTSPQAFAVLEDKTSLSLDQNKLLLLQITTFQRSTNTYLSKMNCRETKLRDCVKIVMNTILSYMA